MLWSATIKQLLPSTETEIFYNWEDRPNRQIKAMNISVCNTSASPVDVYLSFTLLSGLFLTGAVLNGLTIPANETITLEATERVMNMDESIRAYASVADVVALSIDLDGAEPIPAYIP